MDSTIPQRRRGRTLSEAENGERSVDRDRYANAEDPNKCLVPEPIRDAKEPEQKGCDRQFPNRDTDGSEDLRDPGEQGNLR